MLHWKQPIEHSIECKYITSIAIPLHYSALQWGGIILQLFIQFFGIEMLQLPAKWIVVQLHFCLASNERMQGDLN